MKKAVITFCDFIFPPRCICCGKIVSEHGTLCHLCFSNIQFISHPYCSVCGYPFEFIDQGMDVENNYDITNLVCGKCLESPPVFTKARSAIKYNSESKNFILSLKYYDRTDMADAFANWIINCGSDLIDNSDLIVPIPMHRTRLIRRKFNQAALIANKISHKTNKNIAHNTLIRVRKTKPQKEGRSKRALNVKNAFITKNIQAIEHKNILLIDDVITSGATISECANTLLKSGANNVYALSLARA